jgi:hypothetical protein
VKKTLLSAAIALGALLAATQADAAVAGMQAITNSTTLLSGWGGGLLTFAVIVLGLIIMFAHDFVQTLAQNFARVAMGGAFIAFSAAIVAAIWPGAAAGAWLP